MCGLGVDNNDAIARQAGKLDDRAGSDVAVRWVNVLVSPTWNVPAALCR